MNSDTMKMKYLNIHLKEAINYTTESKSNVPWQSSIL